MKSKIFTMLIIGKLRRHCWRITFFKVFILFYTISCFYGCICKLTIENQTDREFTPSSDTNITIYTISVDKILLISFREIANLTGVTSIKPLTNPDLGNSFKLEGLSAVLMLIPIKGRDSVGIWVEGYYLDFNIEGESQKLECDRLTEVYEDIMWLSARIQNVLLKKGHVANVSSAISPNGVALTLHSWPGAQEYLIFEKRKGRQMERAPIEREKRKVTH